MFEEYLAEEKAFEVQQIIDDRIIDGKLCYLVKWRGYPHDQSSWEPEEHLINASDQVQLWKEKKRKLRKLDKVAIRKKKNEEEFDGDKYLKNSKYQKNKKKDNDNSHKNNMQDQMNKEKRGAMTIEQKERDWKKSLRHHSREQKLRDRINKDFETDDDSLSRHSETTEYRGKNRRLTFKKSPVEKILQSIKQMKQKAQDINERPSKFGQKQKFDVSFKPKGRDRKDLISDQKNKSREQMQIPENKQSKARKDLNKSKQFTKTKQITKTDNTKGKHPKEMNEKSKNDKLNQRNRRIEQLNKIIIQGKEERNLKSQMNEKQGESQNVNQVEEKKQREVNRSFDKSISSSSSNSLFDAINTYGIQIKKGKGNKGNSAKQMNYEQSDTLKQVNRPNNVKTGFEKPKKNVKYINKLDGCVDPWIGNPNVHLSNLNKELGYNKQQAKKNPVLHPINTLNHPKLKADSKDIGNSQKYLIPNQPRGHMTAGREDEYNRGDTNEGQHMRKMRVMEGDSRKSIEQGVYGKIPCGKSNEQSSSRSNNSSCEDKKDPRIQFMRRNAVAKLQNYFHQEQNPNRWWEKPPRQFINEIKTQWMQEKLMGDNIDVNSNLNAEKKCSDKKYKDSQPVCLSISSNSTHLRSFNTVEKEDGQIQLQQESVIEIDKEQGQMDIECEVISSSCGSNRNQLESFNFERSNEEQDEFQFPFSTRTKRNKKKVPGNNNNIQEDRQHDKTLKNNGKSQSAIQLQQSLSTNPASQQSQLILKQITEWFQTEYPEANLTESLQDFIKQVVDKIQKDDLAINDGLDMIEELVRQESKRAKSKELANLQKDSLNVKDGMSVLGNGKIVMPSVQNDYVINHNSAAKEAKNNKIQNFVQPIVQESSQGTFANQEKDSASKNSQLQQQNAEHKNITQTKQSNIDQILTKSYSSNKKVIKKVINLEHQLESNHGIKNPIDNSSSNSTVNQTLPNVSNAPLSQPSQIPQNKPNPGNPQSQFHKPTPTAENKKSMAIDAQNIIKIVSEFTYKEQKCFKLLLTNNSIVNAHYLDLKKNCPQLLFDYLEEKCQQLQRQRIRKANEIKNVEPIQNQQQHNENQSKIEEGFQPK